MKAGSISASGLKHTTASVCGRGNPAASLPGKLVIRSRRRRYVTEHSSGPGVQATADHGNSLGIGMRCQHIGRDHRHDIASAEPADAITAAKIRSFFMRASFRIFPLYFHSAWCLPTTRSLPHPPGEFGTSRFRAARDCAHHRAIQQRARELPRRSSARDPPSSI